MKTQIKIGEFSRVSGVTVRTVLYYHQIGLIAEPERSLSGYRLYGASELKRMQVIKRLKALGLSLDQIKAVMGEAGDELSMRLVLQSLQEELLAQIDILQKRVEKVRDLLQLEELNLMEVRDDPPTFRMMADFVGTEQYKDHPELLEQERQLYGIMDDFEWGLNHQEVYRALAEYFQTHPDQYQQMLQFNSKMAAIADLPEEAPEVSDLARECAATIRGIPVFEELYSNKVLHNPFETLMTDMLFDLITPAQVRFCQLCSQYFEEQRAATKSDT